MRTYKNLSRVQQAHLSSDDPAIVDHVEDAVIISTSTDQSAREAALRRIELRRQRWLATA